MWNKKNNENINLLNKNRNESEAGSLLPVSEKISDLKYNEQPPREGFKEKLMARLLSERGEKIMKTSFSLPNLLPANLRQSLYFASTLLLLVALTATSVFFWYSPGKNNFLTGFSKLIISQANAQDNFELRPEFSDSLGVGNATSYILTSKEAIELKSIRNNIKVSPDVGTDIEQISPTQWRISPKKPLEPNTIFRVVLSANYLEDGEEKQRQYQWAYQVKDHFKVLTNIPRNASTNVPSNTGIEIVFSHDNFIDAEKYFSIQPKVEGSFEKHGRTLVFVPTKPLSLSTVYTVRIQKGLPLGQSEEKLDEDYSFSFETTDERLRDENSPWLSIQNKNKEFATDEKPVVQINAANIPNNELEVSVFGFQNDQSYVSSLKKRDEIPWWAYSKDSYTQSTEKLTKVSSFKTSIKEGQFVQFVEFPATLPAGFYLAEFANGKIKTQAWIQISDLAAYINITKTKTLVWLNDLKDKQAINEGEVRLIDGQDIYSINEEGVVLFDTPTSLIEKNADLQITSRDYFLIKAEDKLLITAANESSSYYGYDTNKSYSDDYWQYNYIDKPLYKPSDTIKYWGIIRSRSGQPINETITATLFKEGYVDYFYQPIKIDEQTITLNEFGAYSGEMKFENLRPDYYVLQIKAGDKTVATTYLNVMNYVKPAYRITLTPDRQEAYADETINLIGQASFFEGTPVPNLKLSFETPEGKSKVSTDDQGKVKLKYSKKYFECKNNFGCWPEYAYLVLKPEEAEFSQIEGTANLVFHGPRVKTENKVEYPEKGKASIRIKTLKNEPGQDQAAIEPRIKIEGEVTKVTHTQKEIGTYYDFISKKTLKRYQYETKSSPAGKFNAETDNKGEYVYTRTVEPNTSYHVTLKSYDKNGKFDMETAYLYYFDSNVLNYYDNYSGFYRLTLDSDKPDYGIGEEVVARFKKDQALTPEKQPNKYLYLQLQNGYKGHHLSDSSSYRFNFTEDMAPNINLNGVYFDGSTYHLANYGPIEFKEKSKELKISLKTDKPSYKPGEKAKIEIETSSADGKPMATEVNLSVVDEAIFALTDQTADPLSSLYKTVGEGSIYSMSSHKKLSDFGGGAEFGGCFLAGTRILMANGSEKEIQKIKEGDWIDTFTDPISNQKTSGKVTKTFHHLVDKYLIINNDLKVTPEHRIYSNLSFKTAAELKVGDWLLDSEGRRIAIESIVEKNELVHVYNFRVDPQHTYFANGYYVHNDKGGVRSYFIDSPLFKSIKTDANGKGSAELTLPDNITSWRLTAQAISKELEAGVSTAKLPVSLPVFADISLGEKYLSEDKPIIKMRAFGNALKENDEAAYGIKIDNLEKEDRIVGKSFVSTYYSLPQLEIGKHFLNFILKTEKGEDKVKLPTEIIRSRIMVPDTKSQILTSDTTLKAETSEPVMITISDSSFAKIYQPLEALAWSWGDRADQVIAKKEATELLKINYGSELPTVEFDSSLYQLTNGGIALLPYGETDLELNVKIASVSKDSFDKNSMSQYFFNILEDRTSNKEQISLALSGLAILGEPVLPRIGGWLETQKDLPIDQRLYLAAALDKLGAGEWSRDIVTDIINEKGRIKGPEIMVEEKDEAKTLETTALAAKLASSLDMQEKNGLWEYVKNHGSDQITTVMEEIEFLKNEIKNTDIRPVKIRYSLNGSEKEVELKKDRALRLSLPAEKLPSLAFTQVEGNAMVSLTQMKPYDLEKSKKDSLISIRREYFVNGKKSNSFNEGDLVEIRLYPKFDKSALGGSYQITDHLPSALIPITNYQTISSQGSDCHYWHPYSSDGARVNYQVYKDWSDAYCGGNYIKYFARPTSKGSYKAESVIIQSFRDSSSINFSASETIEIK